MSIELLTIVMFGAVFVMFAAGARVGFALGGVAMIIGYFTWGPKVFTLIVPSIKAGIDNFLLLAIPLFIFMGQALVRSGLGEAMFHATHILAGRMRGGLAIGVIIVCSLIGAMVGIIGAGIMTAGTVAIPPMLKRGYDRHLALGSVMAGGGLGILIPPSVPMILFAAVTQTSIGKMFAGGLVPAAIMITMFIAYIAVYCWFNPSKGPALPLSERGDFRDRMIAMRDGAIAFALIFLVLGSILFGAATPTEAGAVGAVGAVIIATFYRRMNWRVLKSASIETMSLTGVVVWILIGAVVLSNFHLLMGANRLIRSVATDTGLGPMGVIILMQLSMLVLGCIIDEFIIVIICAPIYTPIAVSLGFDPVWFGVLMILNMEIAIQTPPYGFALFYLKSVSPPDVTMIDIYKSIGPFLLIKFMVLLLCMFVPELITWLPNLLFE